MQIPFIKQITVTQFDKTIHSASTNVLANINNIKRNRGKYKADKRYVMINFKLDFPRTSDYLFLDGEIEINVCFLKTFTACVGIDLNLISSNIFFVTVELS